MRLRNRLMAIGAVGTVAATTAFAGTALADFPNFADCPVGTDGITSCIDIQSTDASLTVKTLNVDLGANLEIRGGWAADGSLVAPAGTTGVFSQPVNVPGGIFGVNFPMPGNRLTLTVEKAGSNPITVDRGNLSIAAPVKFVLHNSILGTCTIGTDAKPVVLNMTTGTTSPPAPNEPITGAFGDLSVLDGYIQFDNNVNVDNAFELKGAKRCNIAAAAIMNSALRTPSKAGHNAFSLTDSMAIQQ